MNVCSDALKILVCYYDSYGLPPLDDGILLPIQAGKANSDRDLGIQGDDEVNGQPCDNISEKNPTYSELTGLYWTWKNLKKLYPDVKYVGWTHYRRFFAFNERKYFSGVIETPAEKIGNYRVNPEEIIKIIESGKVIVSRKTTFEFPLYVQYSKEHSSIDLKTLEHVIEKKFPDYYNDFINFMEDNNKISLYCMFIMKYDDFCEYCSWLFSVLSEVEPLIPVQNYDAYQKRVFAFMAERLFNVYIRHKKMNTHELDVYLYGLNVMKKRNIFLRFIYRAIHYAKLEFIFWLMKPKVLWLHESIKKSPES